ncbi:MAG: hypothetical protein V3T99_01885 [Nitrososphaerales archaeon]
MRVHSIIKVSTDVCKVKGMSGNQGVIVPESNVKAVKSGKFHIWPVKTVDEGIETLTGVEAGQRGDFPFLQ